MPKGQGVRPKKSEQMSFHPDAGDNAKFLQHKLDLAALPKVDMKDVEAVKGRVSEYFEICKCYDVKPSIESISLAFGISRRTWYGWTHDQDGITFPKESIDALKGAQTLIESLMADYMQNGKINPVAGIFMMKNNMDYEDKREVALKTENPMGDQTSDEDLQKRYLDAVETPEGLPEKSAERE